MKFPMTCLTCSVENPGEPASLQLLSVQDDSRYEVACMRGHRNVFVIQNPKFDILFEIGAHAILDGYYREAVSSFQASLERCYEFFIRAALKHMSTADDLVTAAWKQVGKQSERQFGAFLILFLTEFGRAPPLLSNKRVEFRNAVIHQGKIPSREQAVDYGQAVFDIVRPLTRDMKQRYSKAIRSLTAQKMQNSPKPGGQSVGGAALSTIVGFQVEDYVPTPEEARGGAVGTAYHDRPLEVALSELREIRAFHFDMIARET